MTLRKRAWLILVLLVLLLIWGFDNYRSSAEAIQTTPQPSGEGAHSDIALPFPYGDGLGVIKFDPVEVSPEHRIFTIKVKIGIYMATVVIHPPTGFSIRWIGEQGQHRNIAVIRTESCPIWTIIESSYWCFPQ